MASLTLSRPAVDRTGQPGSAPGAAPREPSPWLLMAPLALVLALLPAYLSAGVVLALAGAAVVLARPRWALYFVALTVPYQSLYDMKVYGASVTVTEGVILLLLLAWITQLAAGRARAPRMSGIVLSVFVLLLAFLLSVMVATDLALSAKELLKWIELTTVFLAATSLLETPRHRRTMLIWLIGSGVSQAIVGLTQSVLRRGPEHFMIGGVLMRAYGTFEQPNPFGGFLGLVLPITVSLALFGLQPGIWRRGVWLASAIVGTALLLTLSRGAWTGQALALLLVVASGSRAARHALLTFGLGGVCIAAALWPVLPGEITGRVSSVVSSAVDIGSLRDQQVTPENWAVMERLSQWYAGWEMFVNNPFFGVGIGNYNAAYEDYHMEQWPVALGHAHNHYLTIAAEAGLVGLLAYLGVLAAAARSGVRAYKLARDRMGRALAAGILGSLAAFATHNLTDVLFVHGMGVTIGLLLALLDGIPRGMEDAQEAA